MRFINPAEPGADTPASLLGNLLESSLQQHLSANGMGVMSAASTVFH
jgi:hypothetical protein